MNVTHLPTELLLSVLPFFSNLDLKTIRQTCKALNEAVVPILFQTIYLAPNIADMETASLMCTRFATSINVLVYSSSFYEIRSLSQFYGWRMDYRGPPFKDLPQDDKAKLRRLWSCYRTLTNEYESLIKSGKFHDHLCRVIKALPRLRKVVLLSDSRLRENCLCRRALLDAQSREEDPIRHTADVLSTIKPHADGRCVQRGSDLENRQNNPLLGLLRALATTEAPIKELAVGKDLNCGADALCRRPNLPAFAGVLTALSDASQCLNRLSHLTINLRPRAIDDWGDDDLPDVSTFFRQTPNLRQLELAVVDSFEIWLFAKAGAICDHTGNAMGALLGDIALPKLERLRLRFIDGYADSLLRFLRGSPLLKHVTFEKIYLRSGTWAHVVEEMRDSLDLESIDVLEYLDITNPFAWYDRDEVPRHASLIRSFFFEGGPNPLARDFESD